MVQTVVLIVLLLIMASSVGGTYRLMSSTDIGYSSGFQGPKARFYGVKYAYQQYDAHATYGATLGQFDTILRFDPDEATLGKPNLIGEMTTVFIPEESLGSLTSWVPNEWLQHNALIKNPQDTYTWNITDGNSTKVYKMEQWVLKFYLSFSGEWDGMEQPVINPAEFGVVKENYLSDLEAWVEFDLTPTWYIQGGGVAYFAVGKIQLSERVITASRDKAGNKYEGRDLVSVSPESQGATIFAYYGPFGQNTASNTAKTFEGRELNPSLFRDKIFFSVVFNHFGVWDWNEMGTIKYRGDVATFAFDVTVFVIGEWDVKDVQKIPEDLGRSAREFEPASFFDYIADPRIQGLLGFAIIAIVGLVVLIMAPQVIFGLIAAFGGRRRK